MHYYYAAVTYERKNDPVGRTTRGAFIGAANGRFPVTECIKKMHEMAEDIRPGSAYHHVLTGSCRMGRELFAKDKGLSLDGKMSIHEFVELTKDAYGGDIIKQLPQAYGITD